MGLRQILAHAGFKLTIARFGGYPCLTGYCVELDFVPGIYRRAGARIFALVFGFHGFNHGCPLSNQVNISHVSQYARYWPCFGALSVNVCAPVNGALQLKHGTGWPAGIVGND